MSSNPLAFWYVTFLLVVKHVCVNNTLHNVEDKVKQTALETRINNFTKLCGLRVGDCFKETKYPEICLRVKWQILFFFGEIGNNRV